MPHRGRGVDSTREERQCSGQAAKADERARSVVFMAASGVSGTGWGATVRDLASGVNLLEQVVRADLFTPGAEQGLR